MRKFTIAIAIVLGLAAPALAITWGEKVVDDPFSVGAKCRVAEPMSSGSYIYSYPSKWDGVYWPHTDRNWIWRCETSGYAAFGNEFDDLNATQREKVSAWLNANGKAAPGVEGSLERIEALEQFRTRSSGEAAWFKRLMAQWYADNPARADQYRRESIPLMISAIEAAKPEDKIQLYFLLGVYAEKFEGPTAANTWFDKARVVKWTNEDGKEQVGIPYFNELIDELVGKRPSSQ